MTGPDLDLLAQRLHGSRRSGEKLTAKCPFHDDSSASFVVYANGGWNCASGSCGRKGAWPELYSHLGLEVETQATQASRVVKYVYQYEDASGHVVGRVERIERPGEPKTFRQYTLDEAGRWTPQKRYPLPFYKLPSLRDAPVGSLVWVVEGEKACEAVTSVGGVATTVAGGANGVKYADAASYQYLRGKRVIILPDNDDAGELCAASWLSECRQRRIDATVVRFPAPTCKGYDAYDYLSQGGRLEELVAIADAQASLGREANKLASDLEAMAAKLRSGNAVGEVKSEALRRIASSSSFGDEEDPPCTLAEAMYAFGVEIDEGKAGRRYLTGLHTVDGLVGGFAPGWLCVLGGCPGSGKSGLAVTNLAEHWALNYGPVWIQSGEMGKTELAGRCAVKHLRKARDAITASEAFCLEHALRDVPITIKAASSSVEATCASLRLWKAQNPNACAAIIDYLQLFDRDCREDEDDTRFTKKATRQLKKLAGELDITIMLLSSITRSAQQGDKPTMSCFYGGAAIEANANFAACLWDDGNLYILKNRDGLASNDGRVYAALSFEKPFMTFTSVDCDEVEDGFVIL